jgi:hypothetical protein
MAWADDEMAGLDLNDKRLRKRAIQVLEGLAQGGESTPDAFRTKATLEGTYRLIDNDKSTPEALLDPHLRQTIRRTVQHRRVILAHDTTEVDVTKPSRQVKGAGPLATPTRLGFFLHPLMAFTPEGLPLGLASNHYWRRETVDTVSSLSQKRKKWKAKPIEEKESYRWVQMTRQGKAIARENPKTEYVLVSDSESDIYEVFEEMEDRPDNCHLVVRACHDRTILACQDGSTGDVSEALQTIEQALIAAPVSYKSHIQVRGRSAITTIEKRQRRVSREDRTAMVEIRATRVTFRPPHRKNRTFAPITLNIVEAREPNPPEGEPPVIWTLITTLSIDDENAIKLVIDSYKIRWQIEVYFRTLKSGMGLEKLQYQTLERYLNATMLLMIVAWRVNMLTHAARQDYETPCSDYFEDSEWKPALLVSRPGQPLPTEPPSIKQFLLVVAGLGGYINKPKQGFPGTTTVWRGIRRMEVLQEAYLAFGPDTRPRCVV